MSSGSVLYLGNFDFPRGNAAGKRVLGNCKLLQNLGFDVSVIGTSQVIEHHKDKKPLVHLGVVEGFDSLAFQYPRAFRDWLRFDVPLKAVKQYISDRNISNPVGTVILYGSPVCSFFNFALTLFCRKKGIVVLSDCVDWLTVKTRSKWFDVLKRSDDYLQKRWFNANCDGVICISLFLSTYYQALVPATVVIPPLTGDEDRPDSVERKQSGVPLKLVYAGRPFRSDMAQNDVESLKDRIDQILELFSLSKAAGRDFSLDIFGFSADEYLKCVPKSGSAIESLGASVKFHGMVDNQVVLHAVRSADFSVLVRDAKRDSIAGFPTKVAESVSQGTPAIVTGTGDVVDLIQDDVTGILLPVGSVNEQWQVFDRIFDLTVDDVYRMKLKCLDDDTFSPRNYEALMSAFLKALG